MLDGILARLTAVLLPPLAESMLMTFRREVALSRSRTLGAWIVVCRTHVHRALRFRLFSSVASRACCTRKHHRVLAQPIMQPCEAISLITEPYFRVRANVC